MEITVTPRTLRLVDQQYGFDSYILEVSLLMYLVHLKHASWLFSLTRHLLKI